jgi:CMP-N,N'-diacetyllegionaminic acid synthase
MSQGILAVVPARAGSKRLPNKNILSLGGQPLIAWTIKTAIEANVFDKVLVSTDDAKIAKIAAEYGAWVPWLRPSHLAKDLSTSIEVLMHALEAVDPNELKYSHVALLQPTSPFRSAKTIVFGVHQYFSNGCMPVVSVSPAKTHPDLCFSLNKEGRISRYTFEKKITSLRSQDLFPVFEINGAFYITSIQDLKTYRSFLTPKTTAIVMESRVENLDIDDEWDFKLAQHFASLNV